MIDRYLINDEIPEADDEMAHVESTIAEKAASQDCGSVQ